MNGTIPTLTVLGLRAVPAEMALGLAVAASNGGHVARLITILRHVAFLTTVAASSTATSLGTVLGKVSDYDS